MRRGWLGAACLVVIANLTLIGCGCGAGREVGSGGGRAASTASGEGSESAATARGRTDDRGRTEGLGHSAAAAVAEPRPSAPDGARVVTFDARGVAIRGWYWAAPEDGHPAVLLVHQLGSSRVEWQPLVTLLRRDHPS